MVREHSIATKDKRSHYNYYITKKNDDTIKYDYGILIQNARMSRGFTQEKLAEMLDLSVTSVRDYEGNKTKPSVETIKRIAEVCNAPQLLAACLNQHEIVRDKLPPIEADQPAEKTAMRFMRSCKKFIPMLDSLLEIAVGGVLGAEFYTELSSMLSDGLALSLWFTGNIM